MSFFLKKFSKLFVLKLSRWVFCSVVLLTGIAVTIARSHGTEQKNNLKNRIFINSILHRFTKAHLLPTEEVIAQLEASINSSCDLINSDFSILSSLFFLSGNENKGYFYAKKAYEEHRKAFSQSEISDYLFSITDFTEKEDRISAFEACRDLLCLLEQQEPDSQYPLLTALVLMRTALLSSQLHAPEFQEYYFQKLNKSKKFHDVVNLFSEGSCSLEVFIKKFPESCKYA